MKYQYRPGGLMRCCIQSLDNVMIAAVKPPAEGDRTRCLYCHDEYGMVFRNDAWEWAKPKYLIRNNKP